MGTASTPDHSTNQVSPSRPGAAAADLGSLSVPILASPCAMHWISDSRRHHGHNLFTAAYPEQLRMTEVEVCCRPLRNAQEDGRKTPPTRAFNFDRYRRTRSSQREGYSMDGKIDRRSRHVPPSQLCNEGPRDDGAGPHGVKQVLHVLLRVRRRQADAQPAGVA